MTGIFLFVVVLGLLLAPANAHAYLDPGTGGLLYQMGFALFSMAMVFSSFLSAR